MKIAFTTLGCKVNSYETEAVWEKLAEQGYERVSEHEFADIYVVNTCMVTHTAEAKSRQMISRPLKANPQAVIVVMGCLTQLKAEEVLAIAGVKIVVGTKDRDRIPNLIKVFRKTNQPINFVHDFDQVEKYDNLVIYGFYDHQRAFLKIEDGCDNFCSYCIIPYTRGRARSKARELVLTEARELAKRHSEIVLTGIHTGGYGVDLENYSFADLLKELDTIDELKRIRISSIEINELTPEVIQTIASSQRIVHHLHVPLQSGSDKILKLMNRKYTTAIFLDKIAELRAKIDNLSLTTDVIVGFPGETEKDFQDSYELISQVHFDELHVFPYSKRSGTVSASLPKEVDGVIKKARVHQLLDLGEMMAKAAIERQVGKSLKVIVERKKDGMLLGHSQNYVHVAFPGDDQLIGKEVNVLLEKESYPLSLGRLI